MSTIEQFPGYGYGAMRNPKEVRHFNGDNYVMGDDDKIWNCHPMHGGVWPLRFECKTYDSDYGFILTLFTMGGFE